MFKPRKNQRYFMINSRLEVKETHHTGSERSKKRIEAGNCFKKRSEANAARYLVGELFKGNMTGFTRKPWWRFW